MGRGVTLIGNHLLDEREPGIRIGAGPVINNHDLAGLGSQHGAFPFLVVAGYNRRGYQQGHQRERCRFDHCHRCSP